MNLGRPALPAERVGCTPASTLTVDIPVGKAEDAPIDRHLIEQNTVGPTSDGTTEIDRRVG